MPTTKTISRIGDTKFELVKDTDHDAFRFTVDDKTTTPNSPKTVMELTSGTTANTGITSGHITVNDITVNGTLNSSGTGTSIFENAAIKNTIYFNDTVAGVSTPIGRITSVADPVADGNNHQLIIDPYALNEENGGTNNNGTVYIRGNLVVEGQGAIFVTQENVVKDQYITVNATANSDGTGIAFVPPSDQYPAAGLKAVMSNGDKFFQYNVALTGGAGWTINDEKLYVGSLASGQTDIGPFTFSKRDTDTDSGNPDYNSIIFEDIRPATATNHRIFDIGTRDGVYTRTLGDETISVNARGVSALTVGNIVPVELTPGSLEGRESTKTINASASSVPLHADILDYYSTKTFAAGQCVVALTDGTEASVAMFSFSKCGDTLIMVLDQEVHSNDVVLNIDYDSSGIVNLIMGTATSAKYCVKVLPVMTSDSINEKF